MRGLLSSPSGRAKLARITPAYAGTTVVRNERQVQSKDHPCICGDYLEIDAAEAAELGSPLHMRGLQGTLSYFS